MKKRLNFRLTALALISLVVMLGCKKEEETTITITQADLDAASNYLKSTTGGFVHGPANLSGDSTIRDVYSDLSDISGNIPAGSILAKRTYKKGPDGNKTDTLLITFAMVKREAGYDAENENWEYLMMPFDETVDYHAHPNGSLTGDGIMRGMLGDCIACHAVAGGGDYLYSND